MGDWEVAREIAQDAFVQALRHWAKVEEHWRAREGGCAGCAIRDAVRSRKRDARRASAAGRRRRPGAGDPTLALDVRTALLTLPAQQRAVIALYYLDDRPVAEIAALLGCSAGTVKTHLRAAGTLAALPRRGHQR